jgi:hypothetical protein
MRILAWTVLRGSPRVGVDMPAWLRELGDRRVAA